MLKVCIQSDNPSLPTGQARVGREIAMAIVRAGHEVCYIGYYENPPKPQQFPFTVIPCQNRYFGSDVFDNAFRKEQWDVLITIGDMWRLDYLTDPKRCLSRRFFQWIAYTAIDGEALNGGLPKFLHPTFRNPDRVIAYTEYGRDVILKSLEEMQGEVGMIYHGVDPKVFYPHTQEKRNEIRKRFGFGNRFVFLVVSRNQGRKNIPEIFKAWRLVCLDETMPNASLFPHMNFDKEPMGLSISQLMETFGFPELNKQNIMFMHGVAHGPSGIDLPDENMLNDLYNAADCLVMAGSEGFGLPCIEAMACKLPVIALEHSATKELCADGRGMLVPVAYEITGMYMHERPFPSIEGLAKAMKTMYHDVDLRTQMVEKAYRFASQHSWTTKGEEWRKEIERLEYPLSGQVVLKEVA